MPPTNRPVVLAGLALLLLVPVPPAAGQPVTERTPNLEGTWVTGRRSLHFTFSHRFEMAGDADVTDIFGDAKVLNYPTFALTYGLVDHVNLGFRYSSNSPVAGGPNEWQPYVKWSPTGARGDGGPSVGLTAAWNGAAESVDGELSGQVGLGRRLVLLGAVRGLSAAFDAPSGESEATLALAGGLLVRLTRHVGLAADVADRVAGAEGEPAWSAGIQVGIPYTPHTFSLLATNVASGTLQGSTTGAPGAVFWGFEFTVPFSGFARWGEVFDPVEESASDEMARADDPVVELDIRSFSYGEPVRVPAGTTVRWINRDPIGHTVTADEGGWGSELIGPGEVFEHTFDRPGEYDYHCVPHPYMKGTVRVFEPGGDG